MNLQKFNLLFLFHFFIFKLRHCQATFLCSSSFFLLVLFFLITTSPFMRTSSSEDFCCRSIETHLPQSLHYHFFKISLEHKTIWFHWKIFVEMDEEEISCATFDIFPLATHFDCDKWTENHSQITTEGKDNFCDCSAAVWLFLIDITLQCRSWFLNYHQFDDSSCKILPKFIF